jgi:uncharacterized protein with PIN domain
MKPYNSGSKNSPRKVLMVTNSRKIMHITSDICLVKRVKEMITNLGIAKKSLANKLLAKVSTMDVLSRHLEMTT